MADKVEIGGKTVGVVRVATFSQETASQVVEALRDLPVSGINAVALDLRGNAGGYMPAGVDVAKLFLPPQVSFIEVVL